MIAGRHSEDYYPITWVGRFPIYVTTLLVIIHVIAMIAAAVAMSISGPDSDPFTPLIFSNTEILQSFKIWQFVTYAFVNQPTIWFAVEMWMLYAFGREVEKFLGRRAFLWLYLALLLAAPVALTALGLAHVPAVLFGSGAIHFAIFTAFVVIYPNAELFFSIQAKWVAAILLGIYSLSYLAHHAWVPLGVIWLDCACAVFMLRLSGATNASLEAWLPDRDDEPVRSVRRIRRREQPPEPDVHDSIDPLLEKISKHGIGSLTKRERQRLEEAREALLEREKHSH
ncbi:MAG: rhomboid family intramembrane serine protease [Terrimicrobiaceae bacterium]|nr:rhomboid family intramembrane serine protease [Terrimicrobiaceae bacterium]